MSKVLVESYWPKVITVDKRIVRILSASTYDNFPNALKEIITNSYDADASLVDVKIDLKNETITIEDDGGGMNESDFSLYLRIAGLKREKKPKTSSGRSVIGQFGVGFLSVFPFFKNYTIESKTANSNEILYADIPCHIYFSSNSVDIGEIKVQGGVRFDKTKSNTHYTKIKLSGFTNLSKAFFFARKQLKKRKHSILNEDSITILKWRLSEDLPLKYEDERLNKLFDKYSPNNPFQVKINNQILARKIYGKEILEINKGDFQQFGKIKFRFFIVTNRASILNPFEGRFLKIRNLNVGVGDRTNFGLGTEVGGARSRLHWLSGEIHILEGLNDLITVSRDKFNYDFDYEEMKEFFISKLAFHSSQLEKEEELKDFIEQSQDDSKIKNIKLLEPKHINKKIQKINKNNYEILDKPNLFLGDSKLDEIRKEYNEDFTKREDKTNEYSEGFTKRITIDDKTYQVLLSKWDYKTELYSACRIENKILYVNESYPLFKSIKYTDVFIKLHIMLISNLNDGIISKNAYSKILKDLLVFYKDYIK